MADQQKIHPISQDVEAAAGPGGGAAASPTAPLVPRGTSKSDKGDPAVDHHDGVRQQYPPFQRTIPVTHSKPPKGRSCCCRCLCWTVSLLLLQIVVIGIAVGVIFLVFQPKLPKFSVDRLQITDFNLTDNSSLSSTFDVMITARNPNKKIGIYYEGGSRISVWYTGTKLCEGSLPKFYQGHRNTTVLNITLSGETQDGAGLLSSLQQQRQQTGIIPLNLRVRQPVRIKLGSLKLFKVKFLVKCRLDVDSLSANNVIGIKDSSCKFRLRL